MSIARKSLISLAAVLMTSGLVSPSFAAALDISGIAGESSDPRFGSGIEDGGGSTQPVVVCFYVFGGQICVSG
jgi:hypothetical protein